MGMISISRFRVVPLAFGIALTSTAAALAAPPEVTGTFKKWHTVTLTFTHDEVLHESSTDNPFYNYRLDVYFYHADSGTIYRVPGYFAADGDAANTGAFGGDKWRCRFTPDQTGDWFYIATFAKGPGVAIETDQFVGTPVAFDGTTGKFTIGPTDPSSPGFKRKGRLRYVDGHYLQFAEDHEYFLKAGADSPENFLAYYEFDNTYDLGGQSNDLHVNTYGDGLHHYDSHLGDFQTGDPTWLGGGSTPKGQRIIGALNYLASKGVNSMYFLTYNIDQGDGMEVFPWTQPASKLRYDVSKLDQWGIVLDHMTDRGIALHVITQETENDQVIDGGNLGVNRKLYYRELVARFAHNLAVTWNLGEENTNTDAQRKAYADYIQLLDPYDHPLTVHTFPYDVDSVFNALLGHKDFDGASLQIDVGTVHGRTTQWVDASSNAGRKWVVNHDEQVPANSGVKPDADDFWHDKIRKDALWGNLMGQGGGCEWYFGYAYPHNDLDCEDLRTRDHMWDLTRYAVDLFQDHLPFWEMKHAAWLTPSSTDYVMAKAGHRYAVYRKWGGSTSLDLGTDSATYTVSWFDPRVGGAFQVGSVAEVTGPGSVFLGDPPAGGDDWLALLRQKGNQPPVISDAEVEISPLNNGTFFLKVHASDPDGRLDLAGVSVVFITPSGFAAGPVPIDHVGGDAFMAYAENLNVQIPAGQWTYIPIVTDQSGSTSYATFTFDVP